MKTAEVSQKLNIRFDVDVKSALLAGHVIGKTVDIEIGPDDLGDRWQELVALLDVSGEIPACHHSVTVAGPEVADVVAMIGARADAQAKADREREEKIAQKRAELEEAQRLIDMFDPETCEFGQVEIPVYSSENGELGQYNSTLGLTNRVFAFPGINQMAPVFAHGKPDIPYIPYDMPELGILHTKLVDQLTAKKKAAQLRGERIIDEMIHAREPEIRAAMAKEQEAKEAEEKAKQEAKREKFAKRLESGEVIIEFPSYNPRRHGKPWGATVELVNGKLVYSFVDNYTGGWGEAGELTIPCKPGDVIAEGQKDTRRPDRSYHQLRLMREDGGMDNLTKTEAVHALKA